MPAEKNFNSPSTGTACTAQQYITEIILKKWAAWKRIPTQGRFWQHPPFKVMWPHQAIFAGKLLKQYSAKAIIQAINSPEASKIFSLGNSSILEIIEKFSKEHTIVSSETGAEPIADANAKPRTESFGKKGSLERLKDLE